MGSMGRMRKITLWSTASSVPGLCETKYTVPKEPLPSCFWTWRQLCPGNVSRGPFSFRFKILQWKHQGKINGYMLHHVTSYHILPNKRLAATQLALICCDVLDHEWRPVPRCPIAPVLKLKPRRLRETSETFWLHLTRFKDLRGVWYVGRCWYSANSQNERSQRLWGKHFCEFVWMKSCRHRLSRSCRSCIWGTCRGWNHDVSWTLGYTRGLSFTVSFSLLI